MNPNALVSIIMPVFRAQNTLERAIRSLQSQTYDNWQCVICIDDGFDYKSWLNKRGMNEERLSFCYTSRVQSGPNIARNMAKQRAEGEWIAPLDADDLYYPERLSTLLSVATHTGLALDNVRIVEDESDEQIGLAFEESQSSVNLHHVLESNTPLLMLFHREIASHDWEDIARSGDTIFNLRALEKAESAYYVPSAMHEYRVHKNSLCHSPNVGEQFIQAYKTCLKRLEQDGFGFESEAYRSKVTAMIQRKLDLNMAYESALTSGFKGSFQLFCANL